MNHCAGAAVVVFGLAAAACNLTPGSSASPGPQQTGGPGPTSTLAGSTGGGAAAGDASVAAKPSASAAALGGARDRPFARRDTPPGGIDGFLEFTAGGGDFCNDFDERRRPRVALLVGLSGLPIGACGFDLPSSEPADLTVEGPGGWRWSGSDSPDDSRNVTWGFDDLPSPIDGRYALRASQGDLRLEATFLLELDDLHAVVLPRTAVVGETVRLFVTGPARSGRASAYLYRADAGGYVYAADLGPIELDQNGGGRLDLPTQPGDEDGYVVVVDIEGTADGGEVLSGTLDDYLALAASHALTCEDVAEFLSCGGSLASLPFYANLRVTDDQAVRSAEGTTSGASAEALRFAAAVAEIATGTRSARSWVESLPSGPLLAEREFGDALVTISEELGYWSFRIVPPSDRVRATRSEFTVER